MEKEESASVLTNTQREWLQGEPVSHKSKLKDRVQNRLRAAIATDAELLVEALEDGRLNADTVGNSFDFAELGDGISALVAALYRIADESGLDAERTIQKGIKRGKEGRIAWLEQKLEKEGAKGLTVGELIDLRNAKPEEAERLNQALNQVLSDTGELPTGMGGFNKVPEDFEGDFETE